MKADELCLHGEAPLDKPLGWGSWPRVLSTFFASNLLALARPWLRRLALSAQALTAAVKTAYRTRAYLARLDVQWFTYHGSDFTNPCFRRLWAGKSPQEIDIVYDYDFAQLEAVRQRLRHVDRRRVLAEIFRRICAGCRSNTERHLAVLEFCNKAGFHNLVQPMWTDGRAVLDPLILLELGEMRCGQASRVAVDLFEAAGYPGRVVQLAGHVVSEVYYDGSWHYLDAGLSGGRWTVFNSDGTIPSCAELSRRPFRLDAMPAYFEPTFENIPLGSGVYPAWYYFSRQAYTIPPLYYVKIGSAALARASRDYGWQDYREVEDTERLLWDFDRRYFPSAPLNLRREGDRIAWDPAYDQDGDLLGYRVYCGSTSRGWCYGPGWKPDMYDAKFRLPPHDLGVIQTTATFVHVPKTRLLYVTVMAYDAHGEAVGRTLYPMSEELVVAESPRPDAPDAPALARHVHEITAPLR